MQRRNRIPSLQPIKTPDRNGHLVLSFSLHPHQRPLRKSVEPRHRPFELLAERGIKDGTHAELEGEFTAVLFGDVGWIDIFLEGGPDVVG